MISGVSWNARSGDGQPLLRDADFSLVTSPQELSVPDVISLICALPRRRPPRWSIGPISQSSIPEQIRFHSRRKVESQLSAREKLFVWLEQVRQIAFLEYGFRSVRGERRPELQLNGEETAQLYHMVVECNTNAQMILRDANLARVIALSIRQLAAGSVQFDGEMEAECLRSALTWLVGEARESKPSIRILGARLP